MSGSRDLTSIVLPPTLRKKLLDAGFSTAADFDGDLKPTELAEDIGCSFSDARHILQKVRGSGKPLGSYCTVWRKGDA